MEKKKITFFIVTNEAGTTRKFVISATWARAAGLVGAVLCVALIAALVDYFGLLVQSVENKRLKAENAHLEKQFQVVGTKLSALENSLERVKTFSKNYSSRM